jgi:hypothetical protein
MPWVRNSWPRLTSLQPRQHTGSHIQHARASEENALPTLAAAPSFVTGDRVTESDENIVDNGPRRHRAVGKRGPCREIQRRRQKLKPQNARFNQMENVNCYGLADKPLISGGQMRSFFHIAPGKQNMFAFIGNPEVAELCVRP